MIFQGITAQKYAFRSPAWQRSYWKNSTLVFAVRFVCEGDEVPLLELLATQAFYGISLSILKLLAKILDCHLTDGSSLLATILELITHVLKCDFDRALEIAKIRLKFTVPEEELGAEKLLEVDEAVE